MVFHPARWPWGATGMPQPPRPPSPFTALLASVFLTDKYLRSDVAHTMIYGLFDFEGRDLLVPLKGWIYYSPEKGQAFLKKKRSN
mgnify:CR=1 FL=1